jgi:ferredoxin-type protein NapH
MSLYSAIQDDPKAPDLSGHQKLGLGLHALGWLGLLVAQWGGARQHDILILSSSFLFLTLGALYYFWHTEMKRPPGVSNNHIWMKSSTNGKALGYVFALLLTGFYIIYYWSYDLFGYEVFEPLYRLLDPLSVFIRGEKTQPWFFYGTFYTFAVLLMGIRAILKYRHNRYQVIRTTVVMLAQFILSWLIPALLVLFKQPEKYLNYGWPLSYKDLWPDQFMGLLDHPAKLSMVLAVYTLIFSFVLVPLLTYYYGKRWYCSWICGCGGLANTLGDPWRQLSDKSDKAWRIEKVSIYSVLGLITLTTLFLWVAWKFSIFYSFSSALAKFYGFMIGMVFSGVIGVGFYPIFGTRVWCRFGCPQAAILGLLQRTFSRFRITTNGAQCISCGNCSTYCEMGIDVRLYAQKGENINRASCVGCGICANVCPRGVLSLENGPLEGKTHKSLTFVDTLKSGL